MDAARPVDAQTAPTGLWKTADGFPQRPQPVIVFLIQERSEPQTGLTGGGRSRFPRFLVSAHTTEAFLFRRLETLPETRRRCRLNVALPIPFDGQSRLEVDLLCADARVAIELDGAQHLADAAAYRRDRRKDQLLQENDYFILRFLAEDVGRELDLVLDAVLRALSRRTAPSA